MFVQQNRVAGWKAKTTRCVGLVVQNDVEGKGLNIFFNDTQQHNVENGKRIIKHSLLTHALLGSMYFVSARLMKSFFKFSKGRNRGSIALLSV